MAKTVRTLARKSKAAPLATATDLSDSAVAAIAKAINPIIADTFVLYLKTKNFHWHMSGKHFRDYHLLLDEQADGIYASIDPLAERVRKLGAPTVHSFAEILKLATLDESEEEFLTPKEMFEELIADTKAVVHSMRKAHEVCDDKKDLATASLLENYIDEAEKRLWFLFETNQIRGDNRFMNRAYLIVRKLAVKPENVADTITLDHQDRHRRRMTMTADGGLEFLLDLGNAAVLEDGDAVKLEDGRLVRIAAKPEDLIEITAENPLRLMKLAWHLGNRHVPAELTKDALYIAPDHVLVEMVRGLGAKAVPVQRPFRPEHGAYHEHAPPEPAHAHHGHEHHDHGHKHEHAHEHEHAHGDACGCGHDHH